jgi:trimeric autotransporter adhesin
MSSHSMRGQLLRSITSLSQDILVTQSRLLKASSLLEKETNTKTETLKKLAEADANLASLEAQKKFESENDTELVALQQASAFMTMKKQELVKLCKSARGDREKLKEEASTAYFTRLGLSLEVARNEHSGLDKKQDALSVPSSLVKFSSTDAEIQLDIETMWRKISTQSVFTKDLFDGVIVANKFHIKRDNETDILQLTPALDSSSASATSATASSPISTSASSIYLTLGRESLLADIKKSLDILLGYSNELIGIEQRISALGVGRSDLVTKSFQTNLQIMQQNISMQLIILSRLFNVIPTEPTDSEKAKEAAIQNAARTAKNAAETARQISLSNAKVALTSTQSSSSSSSSSSQYAQTVASSSASTTVGNRTPQQQYSSISTNGNASSTTTPARLGALNSAFLASSGSSMPVSSTSSTSNSASVPLSSSVPKTASKIPGQSPLSAPLPPPPSGGGNPFGGPPSIPALPASSQRSGGNPFGSSSAPSASKGNPF